VLGPTLVPIDDVCRREAARTAILYAFDLIESDGEDLRNRPLLDRNAVLARLLRGIQLASCSMNTSPTMALLCSRTLAGLAPKGIVSRRSTAPPIDQDRARSG
jgi:ATP-dependent DNA ligase